MISLVIVSQIQTVSCALEQEGCGRTVAPLQWTQRYFTHQHADITPQNG